MLALKSPGRTSHKKRGVCIGPVARVVAHPFVTTIPGSDAAATTRPPGHMQERIHAPARRQAGATIYNPPRRAPHCLQTYRTARGLSSLQMFDPHAHGERFLRHLQASAVQHGKRIARAVSDGQNQRIARQLLYAIWRFAPQSSKCAVFFPLSRTALYGTGFLRPAPQSPRAYFSPRGAIHPSDVRLRHIQNILRRAETHKLRQDKRQTCVIYAAGQLPVRKRARATFAELDVVFWIKYTATKKPSTAAVRLSTSPPRSSTIGARPARASRSAQNIPAGPKPQTTGRFLQPTLRRLNCKLYWMYHADARLIRTRRYSVAVR